MAVEQTTRTGVYLWSDDTDAFTRSQMTESHQTVEERVATFFRGTTLPTGSPAYERSLFLNTSTNKLYYFDGIDESGSWQELNVSAISPSIITSKGDLIAGLSSANPTNFAVGSNNSVLVADSLQSTGLRWATTLSGLTLSAPIINSPTINFPTLSGPKEKVNYSSGQAGGTVNFDFLNASIYHFGSTSTSNSSINFRGDSSSAFSAYISAGQSVTAIFTIRNGSPAYNVANVQIDGAGQVVRWQGGVVPSGNINSIDVYVFTIIRPTSSVSYEVFGSQTRYS